MVRKGVFFPALPLAALFFLSRYSYMLRTTTTGIPTNERDDDSVSNIPTRQTLNETNTDVREEKRKITLVVMLRGEMANLISRLAWAKGIQLWIQEHHPHLTVELVGERQSGTKWKGAVGALQQCFPNLRNVEFQGGRWDAHFGVRKDQQIAWIGEDNHSQHLTIDRGDSDCGTEELFCLKDQLGYFLDLLQQETVANVTNQANEADDNRYSLPFLTTNQLASFDVLVDQYYDQLKEWLAFDYPSSDCCTQVQPDRNEVVFHLRNFRAEMRERNYLERGYEELTPNQLAAELLGHLPKGTNVTIASRGDAYVQSFLEALTDRGLVAKRTPNNHTGVQDFCFLLRAQSELVGTMRSTYTRWAALLGEAQKVQLYSVDSTWTRRAHGNDENFATALHYQWKQPELQRRIHYKVLKSQFDGS